MMSQNAYELLLEKVYSLDPKCPANFRGDKAGTGRYVLGFLIGGFFGLWIVYWARFYGWRGIWICLALVAIMAVYIALAGE